MKFFISASLIAAILLISGTHGYCQQNYATNVKTEISEDKMLITYDAPAHDGTPFYSIILMITYNGKAIQASSMYGDYGSKVEPGTEKAITWYYTNDFKEDIKKVSVSVFAYKVSEPKVYFDVASKGNNGFAPCDIKVSNSSSNVNEYNWDFGDPESGINNHSTEKEPVHVYEHAGIYNITLTGRNSLLGLQGTSYNTVEIKEHEPTVADFSFTSTDNKPPYEVKFTNASKNGDILSWNFGDPKAGVKNNTSDKPNPVYKYKQAGTYMVELTAKSSVSGLSDKVTKEVTMRAPLNPVAGFILSLSQESAPAIAQFKNSSTNSGSFKWNFGDPDSGNQNSSTDTDPAHTYLKAGKFEVVLIASNPQTGKTDKHSEFVTVQGPPKSPVAGFKIGNNNVFGPVTISFINTSTDADYYTWDFGDPGSGNKNTSNEYSPVHTYTSSGRYAVILRAGSSKTNETNSHTDYVNVIEAAKPPVARFTIENNNTTSPATVRFTNNSSNAVSYSWDFGDVSSGTGNKSGETNPSHNYSKPGKYLVTLTVKSTSGDIKTYSDNVTVTMPVTPLVAGFAIDNNNATSPATIRFSNNSSNADSYSWDFGDSSSGKGNKSGETNPSHYYSKPGTYKVTLTAKSASGDGKTYSTNVIVTEPAKPPVASFTIDNNNATSPATVSFTNSSSNAVSYSWDFGDSSSGAGNKSGETNPSHYYSKSGTYKVTLTAKSASGDGKTYSANVIVTEPAKPPVASFTINNNNATSPATVSFTNSSSNAVSYSWDFGDSSSGAGNKSGETNPSHKYTSPGTYPVTLTVKSASGDVRTYTDNVILTEPAKPAVASFTIDNNNVTSPATVRFTNNSSNAVTYSWNFGDSSSGAGNKSGEANPSHKYTSPGTYPVTLTVKSASGDVRTYTDNVILTEPAKPPVARFTIDNNNATSPAAVRFTNNSSNAVSYSWDFGDPSSGENTSAEINPSHNYARAGKYPVSLTAKNSSGNVSTWSENVFVVEPEILPLPKFNIENNNASSPVSVRFTNTSSNAVSYSWDFGDPSAGTVNQSSDTNPVHTYSNPGRYLVTLTAKNSSGTTRVFTDFVTVSEPPKPPVAKFSIENNNVIGPATVSFSNTSENANVYKWDFGDPESGIKNTSDETSPVHTYLKPGNYKVRLTASEKLTGTMNETDMVVTILEPILPLVVDFTYALSGKYAPMDVSFTNKSENADTYKWLFGDSQSGKNESSGTNPVHRYEKPGTYTITLEAQSSRSGKTQVAIKEITISEKYITYLKKFGKKNSDEVATCILSPESNQYIALINENKTGATIVTFDREGNRFTEKKLNNSIYDIIVKPDKKGYLLAGIDYPNDLIVQPADNQLNLGNPAIVYSNVFDPGYRFTSLHTALSSKNEVGIVGNLVNDANQSNIWFQKTDADGKPVLARGKTFKYVGFKSANQIIPTGDGEFAVTGSYQQDMNSPREMMLGMVSSDGTGKINLMRAKQNLSGCDIIELPNGNFEILTARESPDNPDFSEISLKLVDREINPMNCEIDLIGLMRTSDFRLFPPRMIATSEGYILLTHVFNGTDIDIALLWIDKGGSLLLRKEEIKLPGDQFGTGLILESDGSLVITGAERIQGDLDAIIIKTDPLGKYSDSGDGSGN